MLKKYFNIHLADLKKSKFLKSFGTIFIGTALSQGVLFISLPILARIYSPESFSYLAFYFSAVGILSSVACLRFEISIAIPKSKSEGFNLFFISLVASTLFSLITYLLICVLNIEYINSFKFSIPIGVWFGSIFTACLNWVIREKLYITISKSRVYLNIGIITFQIIIGSLWSIEFGLIYGVIVGYILSILWFFTKIISFQEIKKYISLPNIKRSILNHMSYPKYSIADSLANNIAIQGPILIISYSLVDPLAGFLLLAIKIIQSPMNLLTSSISQVYLSEGADMYRKNYLSVYTENVIIKLINLGFPLIIFISIISPVFIKIFFGTEWSVVGKIIPWFMPWILFQMIASPISMVMHITGYQKQLLYLTLFGLILRIGSVIYCVKYDDVNIVIYYAISNLIFYMICSYVFMLRSDMNFMKILISKKINYINIIISIILGIIINIIS